MRYKELLAVLIFVAMGAWIWAEPSREVELSVKPGPLFGGEFSSRAAASSPVNLVPMLELQVDLDSAEYYAQQWQGLDMEKFQFQLAVTPGETVSSSVFDVTYSGPPNFTVYSSPSFELAVRQERDWVIYTRKVETVGPNHWRFRGADLDVFKDGVFIDGEVVSPSPLDSLPASSRWTATALVEDPRASRYSRGANVLNLESSSVQLTLR